jgi:flagellar biosynthesis protein
MIYKSFGNPSKKSGNQIRAVAIHYEEGKDATPQIVAQGKGNLASKIIELAKTNRIPLQEDPLLVENLLDMDLGDNIPPQLYLAIADILLMISEMENSFQESVRILR